MRIYKIQREKESQWSSIEQDIERCDEKRKSGAINMNCECSKEMCQLFARTRRNVAILLVAPLVVSFWNRTPIIIHTIPKISESTSDIHLRGCVGSMLRETSHTQRAGTALTSTRLVGRRLGWPSSMTAAVIWCECMAGRGRNARTTTTLCYGPFDRIFITSVMLVIIIPCHIRTVPSLRTHLHRWWWWWSSSSSIRYRIGIGEVTSTPSRIVTPTSRRMIAPIRISRRRRWCRIVIGGGVRIWRYGSGVMMTFA